MLAREAAISGLLSGSALNASHICFRSFGGSRLVTLFGILLGIMNPRGRRKVLCKRWKQISAQRFLMFQPVFELVLYLTVGVVSSYVY